MKNVDIPEWLERMPLAPEFRPTDTEFADPIAYISKIEKEASAFGICKIIPPFPKPSRKYVLHNLNKSLSKCPELGSDVNLKTSGAGENHDRNVDWKARAVFTTRHQELGSEKRKKMKGVIQNPGLGAQKQVWQSGEVYTLEQFEAKSKNFARTLLGTLKEVDPLIVEAMFWKASSEKPIYIEYANDVPGSGFSEPEGFMQYLNRCRRRRKRNSFDRKNLSSEVDNLTSLRPDKDSASKNNSNLSTKIVPDASCSACKDSNASSEMEGTAGWKLANSRWNLQVIARSPGSLTRFMPDDIPGVTSPMVYIGMLFSWFAWHVEDHELHSLNFLHMGYPKTWYSVPGDCAFKFEEIIRHQAYGETTDRLAALSRLGQKTTVLSPEVFSALGIPCCRLVQNPGDFVVTFPRAYHIGFSHGFNCGEAANFGTPKWLSLAKEAAVRRAAMNFLPMLSHQQLLYLLTMSFISRIPRCLLPGVRSSRSRDRQKEERELLVKRAFIEDILNENHRATLLLQRNSSHRAVLWDAESLPSSTKESELGKDVNFVNPTAPEKDYAKNDESMDVSQLSTYISSVGFDLNDDDLAYDFKMDSGTLPCVACGVLGFPFMAVVQPSEGASKNLQLKDPVALPVEGSIEDQANLSRENLRPSKEASSSPGLSQSTCSSLEEYSTIEHPLSKYEPGISTVEIAKGWNNSDLFLKPRVFCLEHAIQIEDLLSFKGGANILVICHSDFQKLKAHAAVVAEEIGARFCYNDIPLGIASHEDLNLVDIAIGSETQVDCADWTSQLNVNLQHCVNVKKVSPAKKVDYLLALGGLFCDRAPNSTASTIQWLSRKLRSKRNLNHLLPAKPSGTAVEKSKENSKTILVYSRTKKDIKIIQYSRKRYKFSGSAGKDAPKDANSLVIQVSSDAANENPDTDGKSELQVASSPLIESIEPEIVLCEMNDSIVEENAVNVADESGRNSENFCSPSNDSGRDSEILCSPSNESEKDFGGESIVHSAEETLDEDDHIMVSGSESDSDDSMIEASTSSGHSNCSDQNSSESEKDVSIIAEDRIEGKTSKNDSKSRVIESVVTERTRTKRKKDEDMQTEDDQVHFSLFTKSPCESLRPRARKDSSGSGIINNQQIDETQPVKKLKEALGNNKGKKKNLKGHYKCDVHTCTMSFHTKGELVIHRRNRCTFEGCGKKFSTHKNVVRHQRVHDDIRPLKCPWKGCKMSFKWDWARTEHIRVHTGEKPYACKIEGCGLTFRFVSDFSRHRRKTGHYVDSA